MYNRGKEVGTIPSNLGIFRKGKKMDSIASKVEAMVNCQTCPWDQFCIRPPSMTREEIDERMEEMGKGDEPDRAVFGTLLGAIVFGGKDAECSVCPVFAQRLKESPTLATRIREMMQNWEA